MRHLINTEEGSSKFWEGRVEGSSVIVRYGKIGSDGQTKTKDLKSPAQAEAELAKLVREKLAKGYADAAGSGTGAPAEKPAGAKDARFPFLFFGRRPGDWAEGANMGHAYELRFATPPDAKARLAIAKAFEAALAEGPVRTSDKSDPWRWAGHWALFLVGERGPAPRDDDAFFDAMERALRAIHEVAPLAEAVFMGVRERGTSEWDRWSLEQQEGPSRNPHFGGYVRHPDADYPDIQGSAPEERGLDGSADDAFEAAREKARGGTKPARTAGGAPKPKLVTIEASEFPADPAVPAWVAEHYAEGTPVVVGNTAGGGILALGTKPDSYGQETLSLFFERPETKPGVVELPEGFYVAQAISPDGTHAVLTHRQSGDMVEVALPARTPRKVYSDPAGTPLAASYLDADHVAFLTDAALVVLERDGAAMRVAARSPLEDMTGMVTVGTQIVLTGSDEKVRVVSTAGGALKEVAKLAARARIIVGREGQVFLTNHRFPSRRTAFFRLEGLGG